MYFTDGGMLIDYKSDEKANKFREAGNNEFKIKKFFDALISYNKSICYASTKELLSLGYANRSAVYLEIDCYDECLNNIGWARENGYPADKLSKLEDREKKCKKLMSEGKKYVVEDPWNFFKLSYSANKKIPWIVECLELRTTEKYGRGIYATQDLKAGDIISIEEPVIHMASDPNYYQTCINCCKTCLLNLIPCSQTATLMFCSIDCMDKFYSKTIDMKLAMEDDMKILSEVAAPFGGYKQLDNFINKKDLNDLKKTIFNYDLSDPEDPDYRKKLMICFLSLHSRDNFVVKERTCDIFNFITRKTAMHILSLPISNMTGHNFSEDYFGLSFHDSLHVSLFRSLINHSCLKNVNFVSIDNKLVTIVIKPIKAGEQIFDTYYERYSPKHEENKKAMMKMYKFECDCQECLTSSYKHFQPLRSPFPHMFMSRKDFTKAKEYLNEYWHTLNTSKNRQELITAEYESYTIMSVLGYYATYPCQKMDESNLPEIFEAAKQRRIKLK